MNIRLLIAAATLSLGATTQAVGAVNDWTAIGPSGGTVNKIVFNRSTPSTVYAIAAGGFYRSQDAGVSWQLIKAGSLGNPPDLAIDPSDATRLYVVSPNYPALYLSTDGGASLSPVTTLPTAVTAAVQVAVSANGTTLYVNSGLRIFRSTDRATTWTERTAIGTYPPGEVWRFAIDPTDANTLYAIAYTSATNTSSFVTHDGAMTWQPLTIGDEATSYPRDFAINPANSSQIWTAHDSGVWISHDKGVTWTNVSATGSSTIAIDPSTPAIVYAGSPYGKVFRTADAGVTWTDVTGNNTAGQLTTLAVNPAQSATLLAGGLGGICGTTTSGTQWSVQTTGLNSTTILGLSADKAADRIYMNVSSGGLYYSAGGAPSTVAVNNLGSGGLLPLSGEPTLNVTAMLAQPGTLTASLFNGLARSADGGTTWSPVVPVAPMGVSNQMFALASPLLAPQTILAASAAALYRSTDGGDLWVPAGTGLPAGAIVGKLLAADSDPTKFYASIYAQTGIGSDTYFGVYQSSDAGQSFAPANTGIASSIIYALAIDPSNANIVYTSTDSALLKTMDGGATWNPMAWDATASLGYPMSVAIDPKQPSIVYAATVGRIARSVDGGASWQTLRAPSDLPVWAPAAMLADPNRPENLLVTTIASGAQQFTVAPDLSLTLAAPPAPVAVGVAASYVFTVSNLGPFDATGAQVSVQLPSSAQSISAVASGGATCTVAANAATCLFAIARAGSSNTVTVSAVSPAAGPFQLSASVAGDQPDPQPANNSVAGSETIANIADLSVTASGSASAQVGDAVTYTVVVANAGPNVAAATQLTYQLAAGLTPGSATSSGATCTNSGSGLFTCMVGDLAAAKSVSVTINATAATAGTQKSTATVSSTTQDSSTSNNSATSSTAVTAVPPPAASKGGGGSMSINVLLLLAVILAAQTRWRWTRQRLIL